MYTVTVSSEYEIVIPIPIREMLEIQRGQRLQMMVYENRIVILPLKSAQELRGFLRGIDTDIPRENDRV